MAVPSQDQGPQEGVGGSQRIRSEGARSHRPAPAVADEQVAAHDLYLAVLAGAGKILGPWPRSEVFWGELHKLPNEPRPSPPRPFSESHQPVWDAQRNRRLSCLRIVPPKSKFDCQAMPPAAGE
eukprot:6415749-Pyramimonas_sp.AAC.1